MAKAKKTIDKAEQIKQTKDVIFFKCTEPMRANKFKLLGEMVRHEMKESGKSIVLVPYTVDLGVGEG